MPPENGIPIAYYLAIIHNNKAYGLKTSYDARFANFSPGTVLIWFVMKHLLDVESCLSLDHQKGDEDFKKKFLGRVHEDRCLVQFANPRSPLARLEVWNEKHIVPKIKRMVNYLHG